MEINNDLKVLIFGHGGSLNHGCEAIVRSTIDLLKNNINNSYISLATYNEEEDKKQNIIGIDEYINHHSRMNRYSYKWFKYLYKSRVLKDNNYLLDITQKELFDKINNFDVCFSVGGDNYCYKKPYYLYRIDKSIKKLDKKLILWGASIESIYIDDEMIEDLKLFDLINVRESITYNTLLEKGICKNLHLNSDPAFGMKTEKLELPEEWIEGNMIGINISPLIMNYEETNGLVLKSIYKLIKHILSSTNYGVVLIPHVTWENTNDLVPLSMLYEEFKDTNRVILLGDNYNAPQIKGFISRCKFFVGARTHATIAAYSSGVPTLVLGYSVKARGIARDLHGDETGLVIPVQELENENQILKTYDEFIERESELRTQLCSVLPNYIEKSKNAVKNVLEIIT